MQPEVRGEAYQAQRLRLKPSLLKERNRNFTSDHSQVRLVRLLEELAKNPLLLRREVQVGVSWIGERRRTSATGRLENRMGNVRGYVRY